jgi:hypothetical protein
MEINSGKNLGIKPRLLAIVAQGITTFFVPGDNLLEARAKSAYSLNMYHPDYTIRSFFYSKQNTPGRNSGNFKKVINQQALIIKIKKYGVKFLSFHISESIIFNKFYKPLLQIILMLFVK